ncbi:hypothetical protein MrNuV_ORF071 [Macrobrachium rosenbergii nudivirus]|nr:hypothetical protein MrNuV_ORF071 [Macrobrachium rosenbergii nudivirus]
MVFLASSKSFCKFSFSSGLMCSANSSSIFTFSDITNTSSSGVTTSSSSDSSSSISMTKLLSNLLLIILWEVDKSHPFRLVAILK